MITKERELAQMFSAPWTEIDFYRVREDGFQGEWMGYITKPGSIDFEANIVKRDYPGVRFIIVRSNNGSLLYASDERDKAGVFLPHGNMRT